MLHSFYRNIILAAALACASFPALAQSIPQGVPANRSQVVGTTAVTLMKANPLRNGFSVQNQSSSATCYISTIATATQNQNSLMLPAGSYFESPTNWPFTGNVSIICSAASTAIYAREW